MSSYEVVFSPDAETHLAEIEAYLADRFYAANAQRFTQRLVAACMSLALAPNRGTRRDDLSPGLRMTGFEHRAAIYFKVIGDRVVIIGVFYRGRQP